MQELERIDRTLAKYDGVLQGTTAERVEQIVTIATALGHQVNTVVDSFRVLWQTGEDARCELLETLKMKPSSTWADIRREVRSLRTFLDQNMRHNEALVDQEAELLEQRRKLQERVAALEQKATAVSNLRQAIRPWRLVRVLTLCENPRSCKIPESEHGLLGGRIHHYEDLAV